MYWTQHPISQQSNKKVFENGSILYYKLGENIHMCDIEKKI